MAGPLKSAPLSDLDFVLDLHVKAPLKLTQLLWDELVKSKGENTRQIKQSETHIIGLFHCIASFNNPSIIFCTAIGGFTNDVSSRTCFLLTEFNAARIASKSRCPWRCN